MRIRDKSISKMKLCDLVGKLDQITRDFDKLKKRTTQMSNTYNRIKMRMITDLLKG